MIKAHTGGIRRERGDRGDRALGREVGAGSCSWPLLRCVTWSKSHLLSVPFLSGCQVGGWPCPSSQAGRKAGSALFPMSQPPGSRGEGSACSGTRGQPLFLGHGDSPCPGLRAGTGRSCAVSQRQDRGSEELDAFPEAGGRAGMGVLAQSITTQAPGARGAVPPLPPLLLCCHLLIARPRGTKEAAEALRTPRCPHRTPFKSF